MYWLKKKTIPKQHFATLGKYYHLANPNTEDRADLLCKVCPQVTLLEQKFSEAYTPGKNITVDEGLVKFKGRHSCAKSYLAFLAIEKWTRKPKIGLHVCILECHISLSKKYGGCMPR